MKRKQIDRALEMLLARIDGELAEIRDGLIEVDTKIMLVRKAHDRRISEVEAVVLDNGDHSRKVTP